MHEFPHIGEVWPESEQKAIYLGALRRFRHLMDQPEVGHRPNTVEWSVAKFGDKYPLAFEVF